MYMRAKQKQDQLKNKITSVTGMPDEVILGASVINILGYHKLYIEIVCKKSISDSAVSS